ncbi:MAG: STAS domain-containing protein [Rhodocyclaceae bacterium]|nr:STAS domain-containing protein [Rhodocyclaceae bacterium]
MPFARQNPASTVAFSLFGKKPQPPKPAAGKAPAPAPAPKRPATAKPAPQPQPQAPARAAQPVPASPPKRADEDLGSLDFTGTGVLEGISATPIGDHDDTPRVAPVIEEAAILHANGQSEAACAALEDALKGDLGRDAERGWGMLFDLLQFLGRQEDYESWALEYAGRFEKSPPAWVPPEKDDRDPSLITGGRAHISLTGVLNAKVADQLKQLMKMAEANPVVRLELGKLKDADNGGCTLVYRALQALKRAKKEFVLGGAEELAALLAKKITPGRREDEGIWLLLLELYQQLFMHEVFEEEAVNYAVTFEVSPPSWEAPKKRRTAPAAAEDESQGLALRGEIVAAGPDAFAALARGCATETEAVVDVRHLRRIDFVSAGQLLNALASLQAAGKRIRLRGASHLVAALFDLMGIGQVAAIELRKA